MSKTDDKKTGVPRSLDGLVRYVNCARTKRLIKSRMGQKIIGMSFCCGYDLVHDECTPKELVFRNGNSTVRWS